jgi:hypothetical protein
MRNAACLSLSPKLPNLSLRKEKIMKAQIIPQTYHMDDVDRHEEVADLFTKFDEKIANLENRTANEVNALQTQVDELRAQITKKKPKKEKPKKVIVKRKKKGSVSMKTMIGIIILLLATVSFGAIEWNWEYGTNPTLLDDYMRDPMFWNVEMDTLTLANGATIDNANNNAIELNENSDELIMTFGSNEIVLSSGDVLQIDYGSLFIGMTEISAPTGDPAANTGWLYVADDSGTTTLYFEDSAGQATSCIAGAGSPGGSDTEIQYNNGGAFGGITSIVWDDTNLELANDQGLAFGTDTDYLVNFDDSVDDQLLITTNLTAAVDVGDPMIQILIDADTANGTGITADQDVFGVAKGTQGSNTDLFVVDEDGDVTIAGACAITGALSAASYTGDITLSSGETITNTTNSEIKFLENTGSEDLIFDMDAGTNTVGLKSGSGVDTIAMGTVDDLSGVGTIAFDAEDSTISLAADGTDDLTLAVTGAQDTRLLIQSSGTQEDAIAISTSAGGMTLTVAGAAGAEDLTLASNTAVNVTSSQGADLAINIATSNSGGQIQITSADTTADGLEIDSAGGIDMVAAAGPIVITATGASAGDLTETVGDEYILNVTGGIDIDSDEAAADSILLNASNSAGGVDINYGTGAMTITGTGVAANLTIDCDALSFDFTDSSNISVTSSEAGEDLTISQIGGNDSSIIITSAGQGVNAIELTTSDAVGDIDINAGDAITVDAGDIVITTDDTVASQFHVNATGTVSGDAIILETSSGGIKLLSDGSGTGDITLDAEGLVNIVAAEAAANAFKVDATGAAIAGYAIVLETTEGGIHLLCDGDTEGDITIDSEDDLSIIVGGTGVLTIGEVLQVTDDDIFAFGTGNDVQFNYDEDGLDDLQIKGPVNMETTYCEFRSNPVGSKITGNAGGAVGGTTGDENAMICDGVNFEYHILGAGQTITAPFITADGLNIRLDEADNEGLEMGEGITARSKSAFTIGTDAFYLKVQFKIETVANLDICAIGFRNIEAYNADLYAYDTYAGLNVNNGTINCIEELDGGSAAETDSGEAWSDGEIYTLEIKVSAAREVTQYISSQGAAYRSTSAVTTPNAFTWTAADVVVPFIHVLGDATAGCEVELLSYECGLQ